MSFAGPVMVVLLGGRFLVFLLQQGATGRPSQAPTDGAALAWTLGVVLGVLALAGVASAAIGPAALALLVLLVPLLEPTLLAPWLRSPGYAWFSARFSVFVWSRDRVGGAAVMSTRAALAAGHLPEPPAVERATIGAVAALALHDAARGRLDDARALFECSRWFDAQPAPLRALRNDWLASDAAARGAWDVVALAPPTSPWTAFLRAAALRLLDVDGAEDVDTIRELARKAGLGPDDPFLARVVAARHRAEFEAPPLPSEPLAAALEAHRRALVAPDAWTDLAIDAWDLAAADAPVAPALLDAAAEELRALRPDLRAPAGAVSDRLFAALHQDRYERVRAQTAALRARFERLQDLDAEGEIREFGWFVQNLPSPREAVPEGAALERRHLFDLVHPTLVDWSADLYNRRGEGYLFRAVTRYLLAHARAASHDRVAEVLARNLVISRAFG